MKTKGNEYFYSISGLTVPKYEISESFIDGLDSFANQSIINAKAHTLVKAIENRDIEKFILEMENLDRLLCDIYAFALESESARLIRLADVRNGSLCKPFLDQFIQNMTNLSAEIKLAQSEAVSNLFKHDNPLEHYKYLLTKLKSFQLLANNSRFAELLDAVVSMEEFNKDTRGALLITSLLSEDHANIKFIIDRLIDEYSDKVKKYTKETVVTLKTILIVDDQPEVLSALCLMLSGSYQVFAMPSGQQALQFLSKHRVDAIISDIDMPEIDGYELAKRIRTTDGHQETPIIFLTNNNTKTAVVKSIYYGGADYITKPINRDVILSKLSHILTAQNGKDLSCSKI